MGDLLLSGTLNLTGRLNLIASDGGKVIVKTGANELEALVEITKGSATDGHGQAVAPVLIPPQSPADDGSDLWIYKSFNAMVTANDKTIITQGLCAQGTPGKATWPGMVSPSVWNHEVTINHIAINVANDMGIIPASGASVTFSNSGQS